MAYCRVCGDERNTEYRERSRMTLCDSCHKDTPAKAGYREFLKVTNITIREVFTMAHFDYTKQGRRPTTRQIISDWRKAEQPPEFIVEYGETYARFQLAGNRWYADGNGCPWRQARRTGKSP